LKSTEDEGVNVQHAERSSSGRLRAVEVDPQTDPRWQAFVAAHPDGLIYHHPAYLECLRREYNQRAINLSCEDGQGNIRGILPLIYTRGLPVNVGGQLTRRRLSSLPRTPAAGPLALDDEAAAALMQAAVERVQREPGTSLEVRMWSTTLDGLPDDVVGRRYRPTYVLELPEHSDELRFGNSRHHGAIKRAVAKGMRLGVHVREAETEGELRAWYHLYLETVRWHAQRHTVIPPRSYRFFKLCWELLRPHGLMRLLLAEQYEEGRSRLLAGCIFLMFGQTVFYAYNGRRTEDLPLRPNDAIHWRAIQDACAEGFRHYDLGEVAEDNPGLARFKSKWSTDTWWLHRYYYPPPRVSTTIAVDTSAGYARTVAEAVWQRVPLKATALVGDWIYSFL
jgi:Acetyltransferase (GNAT) domain